MNRTVSSPVRGEPLRAAWAADVTDAVNAVRAAGLSGTLCRDGALATGNEPLPANRRDRRAGAADLSCFHLTTVKAGDEIHAAQGNPFYKAGAVLRWIGDGEPIELGDKCGVICLKIRTDGMQSLDAAGNDGAAEIVCFGSGSVRAGENAAAAAVRDLAQCDFDNLAFELHPLYYRSKVEVPKTDEDDEDEEPKYEYTVLVDFRNALTAQKVELL